MRVCSSGVGTKYTQAENRDVQMLIPVPLGIIAATGEATGGVNPATDRFAVPVCIVVC
jgi:hypothetical protein